jgi:hypothetical protein
MDEKKKITPEEFKDIAAGKRFNLRLLSKDYHITLALYLLKDVKNIYFKGGTALQKIFLDYSRLSEDIDFTVTKNLENIKKEITRILDESNIFNKITKGKDVKGFTRIILHYDDFDGKPDTLFIDLNERAKLLLKPENHLIKHFYKGFIPEFSFPTLSRDEMIAEKVCAAICRNKPRDHYDIYHILKKGIPINMKLVEKKCKQSGREFNIINMFKQAQKLKNRWDEDMEALITEDITFEEIMKTLAKHFKLKDAKEKNRLIREKIHSK